MRRAGDPRTRGAWACWACAAVFLYVAPVGCAAEHATSQPATRPAPPIEPVLADCTLELAGRSIGPTYVASPWKWTRCAGGVRITVHEDTVAARQTATGETLWTARTPDGRHVQWLAADEDVAYLLGYDPKAKRGRTPHDTPARLRRLDLGKGEWLADVPIGRDHGSDGKKREVIGDVLVGHGKVVVLSGVLAEQDASPVGPQLVAYRVTCLRAGETKPIWAKSFTAAAPRGAMGVGIWTGAGWGNAPGYAESGVRRLCWLDSDPLVCAEAMQDILCLDGSSGAEMWRIGRLWEFERGYIGPSMWSHYIGRFGVDDFPRPNRDKALQAARRDFDKRFDCALIGGPVVVGRQILVAVSKGPASGWGGYLSDCILYELHSARYGAPRGGFTMPARPSAITKLPRMVLGSACAVHDGGVVWACQKRAFVRCAPSAHGAVGIIGPFGPDLIGRIDWYRQLPASEPKAWLTAGPACDAVAFGRAHAFRTIDGGYVTRRGDRVYRFPVVAVDLRSGLHRTLVLNCPFKGELPEPEHPHHRGPYHLGITGLTVDGDTLRVVLGMEGRAEMLEFDWTKLLGPAPALLRSGTRPAPQPTTQPAP
jgi:hypothetical protein